MANISNEEMFEYAEKERALASPMTDAELAVALLGVIGSVIAAEQEFVCDDEGHEDCRRERGVLREAAFRLGKILAYETAQKVAP